MNDMSDKKRNGIFISILIVSVTTTLLSTAMSTALLPVSEALEISLNLGQWLTSGYSLVMAIIIPLTAYLIKVFPTKKLYITSIIIFILGLIISAISNTFTTMMFGRILQACGNGVLISIAQVVILSIFPNEKKGTVMGMYGLSITAAPVISPTIAGILVDTIGWRAIFYSDLIIMVFALILVIIFFDDVLETKKENFDLISFLLSAFSFGGITLGIGNIGSFRLTDMAVWLPLVLGTISTFTFIYHQINLKTPFLDVKIFKDKEYALSVISSFLLYFVLIGTSVLMPLYVQSVMGYSATISGLVTLPGALVLALVSPLAGKLFDKYGIKKIFVMGSFLLVISTFSMNFINFYTPILIPAFLHLLRCVAVGCLMMPIVTWGTLNIEKTKLSDASAFITSIRTVGGAIGAAVLVNIMTTVATNSSLGEGFSEIYGLNIAYLFTSFVSILLFVISIFFVKKETA